MGVVLESFVASIRICLILCCMSFFVQADTNKVCFVIYEIIFVPTQADTAKPQKLPKEFSFAHKIAKSYLHQCLYLDTDILCIKDVSNLFKVDLKDKIAYVIKDATSIPKYWDEYCKSIGMKSQKYFNSGVLLIDIDNYLMNDIGIKAIKLASKNDYKYLDQDVLNILLEGKVIFDNENHNNCTMSVQSQQICLDKGLTNVAVSSCHISQFNKRKNNTLILCQKCFAGTYSAYVKNGKISPCEFFTTNFVDLSECKTIHDFWYHKFFTSARKSVIKNKTCKL